MIVSMDSGKTESLELMYYLGKCDVSYCYNSTNKYPAGIGPCVSGLKVFQAKSGTSHEASGRVHRSVNKRDVDKFPQNVSRDQSDRMYK